MYRDGTTTFLLCGMVLIVGIAFGSGATLLAWKAGAERGMFEVGHVVYVAKPLRSTAQGAVCAQDIPGLIACTSGADK